MICEIVNSKFENDIYKNIVYINGMPAFIISDDGSSKEPITPNGMVMYGNNEDKIDGWLKNFPNIEKTFEFVGKYDHIYEK